MDGGTQKGGGMAKEEELPLSNPLASATQEGNKKQAVCGKLLRYSSKIRIPYRGNSRQPE